MANWYPCGINNDVITQRSCYQYETETKLMFRLNYSNKFLLKVEKGVKPMNVKCFS